MKDDVKKALIINEKEIRQKAFEKSTEWVSEKKGYSFTHQADKVGIKLARFQNFRSGRTFVKDTEVSIMDATFPGFKEVFNSELEKHGGTPLEQMTTIDSRVLDLIEQLKQNMEEQHRRILELEKAAKK